MPSHNHDHYRVYVLFMATFMIYILTLFLFHPSNHEQVGICFQEI